LLPLAAQTSLPRFLTASSVGPATTGPATMASDSETAAAAMAVLVITVSPIVLAVRAPDAGSPGGPCAPRATRRHGRHHCCHSRDGTKGAPWLRAWIAA